MLTGTGPGARREMFYFTDDGDLAALRYDQWKLHFMIQEHHGLEVWERSFTPLRLPMLFNLRADPFERATESMNYNRWRVERAFALVPAQGYVGKFLESFKDFPPRQKPLSADIGKLIEQIKAGELSL